MAPLKKILATLILMAFLAVKGGFWLAMDSPPKKESKPTVQACACTGEPICRCGPGGCCALENKETLNTEGPQVQAPKVCGSFSKGMGPVSDVFGLPGGDWNWLPEPESPEAISCLHWLILLSVFDSPDPPVPRV